MYKQFALFSPTYLLFQREVHLPMWLTALFLPLILLWSFFINMFWYLIAEYCVTRPTIRQNVSKFL